MSAKKYVHRPTIVEAIQFDGTNIAEIGKLVPHYRQSPFFLNKDGVFTLHDLNSVQILHKGCWIVFGISVHPYVVPHDVFITSYDEQPVEHLKETT